MAMASIETTEHVYGNQRSSRTQPRLLIVDDDPRALRLFRRVLSQTDQHCVAVERANEVPAVLREHKSIDVVLSDLRMPQIDGIELIKQLRRDFSDRRWMQFILVTGQASIESVISALRLEAVDFLSKPIMPKDLLVSVRNALQKTQAAREMYPLQAKGKDMKSLQALAATANALAADLHRIVEVAGENGARPAQSSAIGSAHAYAHAPVPKQPARVDSQEYESLRFLMGLQEVRSSLFGDALLPDPAWEMLAELMLAQLNGRKIAITSLCLASKTPVTTALRRIDDLIDAGIAVRTRDPVDRRRSYIELTEQGREKMQHYLVTVTEKLESAPWPVRRIAHQGAN